MRNEHELIVDGSRICYITAGSLEKETVLFLHGWPGTNFLKSNLLDELAKDFFVIAPEHPGFLRSEPLKRYDNIIDQYADVAYAILRAVGKDKEKCVVLGQSFGATVAGAFAERHPENVDSLVFSSPYMCTANQDWFRKFLWKHSVAIVKSFLYLSNFLKREGLKQFHAFVSNTKATAKENNKYISERLPLNENATKIFRESMLKNGNLLDRKYGNFPIVLLHGTSDGKLFSKHGYVPLVEAENFYKLLKMRGANIQMIALNGSHTILYSNPKYAVTEMIKLLEIAKKTNRSQTSV